MTSPLPVQRPQTPPDVTYQSNASPLSPGSESTDRRNSLRRRPSFSFLRRSKSREGATRTVSANTARSSSGGSISGRRLSKKNRVLQREQEMRQENLPPQPPKIPDIPRLQKLQTFGGEDHQPDSVAIMSGSAQGYNAGRSFSHASRNTPGLAVSPNIPIPPIPAELPGSRSPVSPYARADSITHRGRYSYASSMASTVNGPRRLRRRKDPTPFNVLVVGARNSGKTSFLDYLRTSLASPPSKHRHQGQADAYDVRTAPSTVGYPNFTPEYMETEIGTERVGVTLWDSQGLERNLVDLQLREISSFVEGKFEDTFTEENRVARTPGFRDTHIHCVILLLDPARLDANIAATKKANAVKNAKVNGNSFAVPRLAGTAGALDENLDLQVMRVLKGKTTVVPIIAKADSITTAHMAHLKRMVWDSIKRAQLDDYETIGLGANVEEDSSEDEKTNVKGKPKLEDRKLSDTSHLDSPSNSEESFSSSSFDLRPDRRPTVRATRTPSSPDAIPMNSQVPTETPYLPLSIISPDLYEPNVLGRKFPWGFADPNNAEHCDFVRLKDMIFSEWRGDLREASREVGYEGWRTSRLNRQSARAEARSPPRSGSGYTGYAR
ncbi:MAG: hypothetical protein Q9218_002197 [Villophora microphyllina]